LQGILVDDGFVYDVKRMQALPGEFAGP
jgi:hypothetical protein